MSWTTDNEKSYIDCLATARYSSLPPAILLRNYIRGAKRRERWRTFGRVDPKEVIRYAEEALARLEGTR